MRGLAASGGFDDFKPVKPHVSARPAAGPRRALTWKVADGRATVKRRLVTNGFQDPDLKNGLVETAGRVSLLPSPLKAGSLSAVAKWRLRGVGIRDALPQADNFDREVFLRAPTNWSPRGAERVWKFEGSYLWIE